MSGFVFKVMELQPCCGRIVHQCMFISAFADHALKKVADLASAHPGVAYELVKTNVFSGTSVVVDTYRVER